MTLFKVSVDFPAVDQNHAATLMFHHLQVAAALFEAIPEGTTLADLKSHFVLATSELSQLSIENPAELAGLAFLETIFEFYAKLDKEAGR